MICKICNQETLENNHWYKNHKITQKNYFEQYFPKTDLFDGTKIQFKSEDSYFLQDFNNKINLKKYLESISKQEGLSYLQNWLLKRKEQKNLIYAPGEFECRSLQFPSIKFIHKYYGQGSYENICKNIKLKLKYNYNIEPEYVYIPEKILIDNREQKPYIKLDYQIELTTLKFADYCSFPNIENVFYERKELSDWAGVMSKGYSRFEREIQRARDNNSYVIVLIEGKYSDLTGLNYLPQTRWIKASSDFLLKRSRDLYLKFNNFQMVCGGNRKECMNLLNKLVKIKNIQEFDIQLLIDCNKIN